MKKVMLIVLVALLVVSFFGLAKIQTWTAVGKEALVEKIDQTLGEYDVKRTEAAEGVKGLEKTLRVIREGQIKSEVKSEQLGEKLVDIQERQAETRNTLKKMRERLTAGETLVLGGRAYEAAELNGLAQQLIALYESLQKKQSGIEKAKHLLDQNAANLQAKAEQGRQKVVLMKSQLEEIDAKILALTTMRDAAESSGHHVTELADAFKQVEEQLDSLYASVETGLRMEESAWQDTGTGYDLDVEQVVEAAQYEDTTISRIDLILSE